MGQTRVTLDADMRLHAEVLSRALLRLMHVRVVFAALLLSQRRG
jgi:hypothetical protein